MDYRTLTDVDRTSKRAWRAVLYTPAREGRWHPRLEKMAGFFRFLRVVGYLLVALSFMRTTVPAIIAKRRAVAEIAR